MLADDGAAGAKLARNLRALAAKPATVAACAANANACFAAGTKLWTPTGYRNIEDIRAGDAVYSRDQWDAAGAAEAKAVEEVFARFAGVYNLHVGGEVIATTGEHPFFVAGKGWTPANELRAGDRLTCADGTTVAVEEVFDTGGWVPVYNLRVADFHTYFVGCDEWGWAAWAHNADACSVVAARTLYAQLPTPPDVNGDTKEVAKAKGFSGTFASGQTKQVPGFEDPRPLVPQVMQLAATIGLTLPKSGAMDHLGDGSWYAGHAEKFATLYGNIIAIKPLDTCSNCNSWFITLSQKMHLAYYVAVDATRVKIYEKGAVTTDTA